jgi:hypothetical protein
LRVPLFALNFITPVLILHPGSVVVVVPPPHVPPTVCPSAQLQDDLLLFEVELLGQFAQEVLLPADH